MATESVEVEISPDPADPDRCVVTFPIYTAAEGENGELMVTETSEGFTLGHGQGFTRDSALEAYKAALERQRAEIEAQLTVYDQDLAEVDVVQSQPPPIDPIDVPPDVLPGGDTPKDPVDEPPIDVEPPVDGEIGEIVP